jgi:hypothetical protein
MLDVAMRLEIAPVVARLAELASPTGKKRHLQDAIEQLRADNIPDELQDAALRELEKRWRELG